MMHFCVTFLECFVASTGELMAKLGFALKEIGNLEWNIGTAPPTRNDQAQGFRNKYAPPLYVPVNASLTIQYSNVGLLWRLCGGQRTYGA